MEGKKPSTGSSSSSIVDELFGSKEASQSSSSAGYFSTVFPPASTVMGKDSSRSDLHRTLNKQRPEGQIGNTQSAAADGKSRGGPNSSQNSHKDGKPVSPFESIESPYFGSSVHYGARDFYTSSSMHTSESPKKYKNDEEDDSGNSNVATRGDWWQGSLYY